MPITAIGITESGYIEGNRSLKKQGLIIKRATASESPYEVQWSALEKMLSDVERDLAHPGQSF